MNASIFAAFAVVRVGGLIWATTRDGKDAGRIGLPGGKTDPGESPAQCARREAAEEGLHLHGSGTLAHTALVEGRMVQWFEFDSAMPLHQYKEQARGIRPVLVPVSTIALSGYGNEFLGAQP